MTTPSVKQNIITQPIDEPRHGEWIVVLVYKDGTPVYNAGFAMVVDNEDKLAIRYIKDGGWDELKDVVWRRPYKGESFTVEF